MSDTHNIFDAIDHLHGELNVIKQQLRLYANTAMHKDRGEHPITVNAETFHIVMDHLARQMASVMAYADALQQYRFSDAAS